MATPKNRPLKRKQNTLGSDLDTTSPTARNSLKRAKSENVSQLKRYLIGCAHLIYVKADSRERDQDENIIPLGVPIKKSYAPSSDLPQKDMVALYFDDIDRTVVSQSKSKTHAFAAPDWSIMEPYLFVWIRANESIATRSHIKHVAFRLWEGFSGDGRVIIKYGDELGQPQNVPLGDVRGWWWDTDGPFPRNYHSWLSQYDGVLPGTVISFRQG
jgi:hypothetical protein